MPVYFPDFLPTALDLAGAPAQASDGVSLKPHFLDPRATVGERFMYWEFYEPVFRQAARLGNWKAVRLSRGAKLELYDALTDPWESKDVADAHPDIVARIEQGMAREHIPSAEYPDPVVSAAGSARVETRLAVP